MCAGAVVSFLAAPTELVKCRLQHQGSYESASVRWRAWNECGRQGQPPTLYRGPWDAITRIYSHEGGLKACFNGLGATLLREVPGNGLMFAVYEGLKMTMARWKVWTPGRRIQSIYCHFLTSIDILSLAWSDKLQYAALHACPKQHWPAQRLKTRKYS
jgi:hypothetical protein